MDAPEPSRVESRGGDVYTKMRRFRKETLIAYAHHKSGTPMRFVSLPILTATAATIAPIAASIAPIEASIAPIEASNVSVADSITPFAA
jgi:hypothetical protein